MTGNPRNSINDPSEKTALQAELIRALRAELARARLRAANLEAAINAALSARESGESDPFWYLRDEITCGHGDAYGA